MENEFNIDTFIQEQSQPTEVKQVNIINNEEPVPAPTVNNDDFVIPEENEEATALAEKVKEHLPIDARKEARNYAVMIDMTQRMLFTGLQKGKGTKNVGGRENWNKTISLADDVENKLTKLTELTPEERKNVKIVNRTLTKIKRLPLNSEEKEMWIDALEGIVVENGYKMPPSVLIFIAIINMAVPRVTDLMID